VTRTLDGQTVRIVPGNALELALRPDTSRGLSEVEVCLIDVHQSGYHVHETVILTNREGVLGIGYRTVDSYLNACEVAEVEAESLFPHDTGERLSMEHMNDHDFVQYCYFWLLGRDADPSGLQHYLKAIDAGMSRKELILALYHSQESIQFRRLAPIAISGQAAFPFSDPHDQMRKRLGALDG
jgi:hypothetical protein